MIEEMGFEKQKQKKISISSLLFVNKTLSCSCVFYYETEKVEGKK